ncbi:MAG: hypothetical protein ABI835_09470, partial [Chloroflexota bacterium]
PEPPSALTFIQQDRLFGRMVAYYDLADALTVRNADASLYSNRPIADREWTVHGSVYVSPRSTPTGMDLFVISSDNQILRQLTHIEDFPPVTHQLRNLRNNVYPQWSPDEQWIAFVSTDPLAKMDLFLIRLDGSGLRRVASDLGTPTPLVEWKPVPQRDFTSTLLLVILPTVFGLAAVGINRLR